jgi:hypothetical protein
MCDVAPAIDAMMVHGRFLGRRGDFARSLLELGYGAARAEATGRLQERLRRLGLPA